VCGRGVALCPNVSKAGLGMIDYLSFQSKCKIEKTDERLRLFDALAAGALETMLVPCRCRRECECVSLFFFMRAGDWGPNILFYFWAYVR